MSQEVVDLDWVDFDLRVPPSGPATSAKLPSAREEFGTQNPIKPTQVYDHLGRPVYFSSFLYPDSHSSVTFSYESESIQDPKEQKTGSTIALSKVPWKVPTNGVTFNS